MSSCSSRSVSGSATQTENKWRLFELQPDHRLSASFPGFSELERLKLRDAIKHKFDLGTELAELDIARCLPALHQIVETDQTRSVCSFFQRRLICSKGRVLTKRLAGLGVLTVPSSPRATIDSFPIAIHSHFLLELALVGILMHSEYKRLPSDFSENGEF